MAAVFEGVDDGDFPVDTADASVFGAAVPIPPAAVVLPVAPEPPLQPASSSNEALVAAATAEFLSVVSAARRDTAAAEARAERAERRCAALEAEVARLRGGGEWAAMRDSMRSPAIAALADESVARECGVLLPSAAALAADPSTYITAVVARFVADTVARATFAELCQEQRRRAHQCELENLRAEADARVAGLEAHVAACRAEVQQMRAQQGDAAAAATLRIEVATLEERRDQLTAILRTLRGEITSVVVMPLKALMKEEEADRIRKTTRREVEREALATVRARNREELERARSELDRIHRLVREAEVRVGAYQDDAARVAVALETAARRKLVADLAIYHRRIEALMGVRHTTAATTLVRSVPLPPPQLASPPKRARVEPPPSPDATGRV